MASSTLPTASSALPVKILTVGSAVGSIRDLFLKIKAIDAKHGKFDCVLCIGDFFGPLKEPGVLEDGTDETEQLLNGDIEVPLKCYIMQGENPLPDSVIEKYAKTSGELCKDVFLLNKSGIMTTAHGLRIACLGGIYNPGIYTTAEAPPGFASPFFSTHTVERLLSNTLVKSSSKSQSKNQTYTSLTSILNASSSSQLVDILITNDWPACITQHSSAPLPSPELSSEGATPLDEVIRKVKPRYHFAALGGRPPQFWEREPFVWDDEAGRVSRFVSLGAFGAEVTGGKKPRWFYAFSITPPLPSNPVTARPTNATKNPFTEVAPRPQKRTLETFETTENFIWGNVPQHGKRPRTIDAPQGEEGKPPPGYKCRRCESTEHFITSCPERQKPPEGYVCRICNTPGHLVRDCPTRHAVGDTGGRKPRPGYVCRACASEEHYIEDCPVANAGQRGGERRGKRDQIKEIGPDECWFCLSNPNLAKHLIVSIGNECYVTLPKGQIIPTQSNADGNNSSISTVPGGGHVLIVPIAHHPTYNTIPADIAPPILEETDKYKSSLRALYAAHNASAVFFEVGRLSTKGGHAHVQAVPVPISLAGKVEQAFKSQGINFDGTLEDCQSSGLPGGRGRSYFRVDLPDGRSLVHLIEDHAPFGVQFGRQVLTDILGIPDRVDWKACMLPEEEDKADVKAFKAAFASFDPSM
ncbi:CwfJ C-terminus 1-domain-containing protein-like protein [Suillus variegatus]|nr:CwfJ C-terminus 1-domain-containing protein-like protein [Suillus variegatus]